MTKLYFDNLQGVALIDGVRQKGNVASVDGNFSLQYIPYDDGLLPILLAFDGKSKMRDDVIFIRHGKDCILKFCPKKKAKTGSISSEVYIQKVLEPAGATAHCLTCHQDDTYKISVETKEELFTTDTPCKVLDVKFGCASISDGQLLSVFAKLDNGKTYALILHYNGDYTLLLDICCDELNVEEDGLRVCDCLRDTLNRRCIRKLSFCGDCFAEISRHFENACDHNYIDEIIPYVFVESVCYGDWDCARNCLGETLSRYDCKALLGDFVGICDCLEYSPFEIPLLYSDCDGLYTKTFRFAVTHGKIQNIILTKI